MRVLLATDRLGGNLPSPLVASWLQEGWRAHSPEDEIDAVALSDGGSGLLEALSDTLGGELHSLEVTGPLGQQVPAAVLHLPGQHGGTAVVSGAEALGMELVTNDALAHGASHGTSHGLGTLLDAALATGASRIVVGLPPVISHDSGAGLLAALHGEPAAEGALTAGGAALGDLSQAALAGIAEVRTRFADRELLVAAADDAPLIGLHGAGAALAGRAGIDAAQAQVIDTQVAAFAALLEGHMPSQPTLLAQPGGHGHDHDHGSRRPSAREPFSGAGGGAALMLQALGARLLPGGRVVTDHLGLAERAEQSELVVTTTEVLDYRALGGSVLASLAEITQRTALPLVVLAGEVQASRREMASSGVSAAYQMNLDTPQPAAGIRDWGSRLARTWSPRA